MDRRSVGEKARELIAEMEAASTAAQLAKHDQAVAAHVEHVSGRLHAAHHFVASLADLDGDIAPADLTDEQILLLADFCVKAEIVSADSLAGYGQRSLFLFCGDIANSTMSAGEFVRELVTERDPMDFVALRVLFDVGIAVVARRVYRAALAAQEDRRRGTN